MFPVIFINEDFSYKIMLAFGQRWAVIITGALTVLNFIIPQRSLARKEGCVTW